MKKWSVIVMLLAQNLTYVQAVEAASMCLSVEPQCFASNFEGYKTLKPPGRPDLAFPTDPIRIVYSHRGNRSIFYRNNVLDRQMVKMAFDFIKEGRSKGANLDANLAYLQNFLKSSSPNITLEYMLTYTVFKQLDEIQVRQNGKFFDSFKGLAQLFDKGESEIIRVLTASAQGKGLIAGATPAPTPTPTQPPVKPTPPAQPAQPQQPPVVVQPTQPTPPAQPVTPAPVPVRPEQDVIGSSSATYANEVSSSAKDAVAGSVSLNILVENGRATETARELRSLLRAAKAQGLNPDDYWGSEIESLYADGNIRDAYRFHSLATAGALRYAMHVSSGRLVGSQVDESFRYDKKEFKDIQGVIRALNSGALGLRQYMASIEPTHVQYKQLKANLAQLRGLKAAGRGSNLKVTESALVLGKKDSGIPALRERLFDFGYKVTLGSDVYDAELEAVLKNYNSMNALPGKVTALTLGKLNVTFDKRIQQIEANLERLRWLPVGSEDRYIFINLGFSEFKLFTGGRVQMSFRTVNGRLNGEDDKKTPSQTQVISHVLLNPTWTVPAGMAYRAKLPLIKQNPNWLRDNNFRIATSWSDERVWDPVTDRYVIKRLAQYVDESEVDFDDFKPNSNTPYWLVQQPGYNSTLGVLKFPLFEYSNPNKINPLDIYMHDTNERHLFANARRLESSGCVRLQYPVELAAELIQGYRGFDIEKIKSFLPASEAEESREEYQNMRVDLPKAVTVHMMYLSAEMGNSGELRFIEDEQAYKLDAKVLAALKSAQ